MKLSAIQIFKNHLYSSYPSFNVIYGVDFIHKGIREDDLTFEMVWTKEFPNKLSEISKLQKKISDYGKLFQIRIIF